MSPLACQFEEQEEPETPTHKKENLSVMLSGPSNKIAAHWARKIANRKARTGILDTGATSGAGRLEDAELFENTGQPSTKVFMLPDKSKVRATQKMLLKHKIREGARETNIVPGLHTTLVSVPKMVDEDYIVVFNKKSAKTYVTRGNEEGSCFLEKRPEQEDTRSSPSSSMELKFELDTRLTVSCVVAVASAYGLVTVSIAIDSVLC